MTDINTIIKQLRDGHSFMSPHNLGVLKIVGPQAQDFLQRMSTADLSRLSLGQSKPTCFLNKLGRLVDRVLVIATAHHEFLLVSSFADGQKLFTWLEQFHFIEDFSIELSEQSASLVLSSSEHFPPLFWWQSPSEAPLSLKIAIVLETSEQTQLDEETWEILRIAATLPWAAHEISDRFMPQNVGLNLDISSDKGCYLGQEVIAKALTYQKNPKFLAGIKLLKKDWEQAKIGARVSDGEQLAGEILSLSPCFIEGFITALALSDQRPEQGELLAGQFIFNK
jgi:folate-binding protein YgfZ